ncbi:hypothetical protein BLNAU_18321 [Blattamonas nauphoetae]|uniref:Uncharacterized protein n=1 Tax=Blattamonas nauphoetae TaxID=2049346 RepID=A0ABQ9X4W0_9EUKA|nr:hypothetical protein BLNAU_18321 [Blattamonas nauphoetae]
MAKTIGEEKKEDLDQVKKKGEPKVQENTGRHEKVEEKNLSSIQAFHFKIQHAPHTKKQRRSQCLRTHHFQFDPDGHTRENRKGEESKTLGGSLRSGQGVKGRAKQKRK